MRLFKRYKNPHIRWIKRTPVHFLAWFLGFYKDKERASVPEDFQYPIVKKDVGEDAKATFVGHCTYILEVFGITIVTDPVWNERCSPFKFFGPKRRHDPPVEIEELKNIDYVLISHNHYDHLDLHSVQRIYDKFPNVTFIVPVGVRKWFIKKGFDKVQELDWWQRVEFCKDKSSPKIEVSAVPAQHHSGRGLLDANKTLWAGFVVTVKKDEKKRRFYFTGDTAYNPHDFKNIGNTFRGIDLTLCPIGTYSPKKFMETVHLTPEGAVALHRDVGTTLSLGMHWGTFCLSSEPFNAPPYDLFKEMEKNGVDHGSFLPIPPGTSVNW